MTEQQKQLELLNDLFAASRGDCTEEWNEQSYLLADIIRVIGRSPKDTVRELLTDDLAETLVNVYKIPETVAKTYVRATPEFMDNVLDKVYEAALLELEDWIPSTSILSFQNAEETA
jgi:hypothetical protein